MAEIWVWDGKSSSLAGIAVDKTSLVIAISDTPVGALLSLPGTRLWTGAHPALRLYGADPIAMEPTLGASAIQFDWTEHRVTVITEPHWFPEVLRYFKWQGSDLILTPFMNDPCRYTALWRDVQQNQFIGLSLWPLPQLSLPCEMTADDSGLRAGIAVAPGLWQLRWDWEELMEVQRSFPVLTSLRPDVYRRHRWWQS